MEVLISVLSVIGFILLISLSVIIGFSSILYVIKKIDKILNY